MPEDRQAAAQGLASAIEVGAAAVAALGLAAIYDAFGDTTAWAVTGVTMTVLLSIGLILTKETGQIETSEVKK